MSEQKIYVILGPPKVSVFEDMISGMLNWDLHLVCPFHSKDEIDSSRSMWYKGDTPIGNTTDDRYCILSAMLFIFHIEYIRHIM